MFFAKDSTNAPNNYNNSECIEITCDSGALPQNHNFTVPIAEIALLIVCLALLSHRQFFTKAIEWKTDGSGGSVPAILIYVDLPTGIVEVRGNSRSCHEELS